MIKRLHLFPLSVVIAGILALVSYGSLSIAIPDNQIPVKELRLFSDIYKQIKLHYVEEVADVKLFDGAVKGMLRTANPSTAASTKADEKRYLELLQVTESDPNIPNRNGKLPLKKLRIISNLYGDLIHKNQSIEGSELFEGAIYGMLNELDPYSTYLKARAYQNLKIGTDGKFGGLGIIVGKKDDLLKIMEVLPKTPAERAGLEAQDSIVRVDDKWSKDLSLGDAVDMMRGKKGTDIDLLIERDDMDAPFPVTLTRDTIKRESVKYVLLDDNIGYVRITNFQMRTSHELKKTLAKLKKEHNMNGLILDLRFNPGGILNEAVAVSDIFLSPKQLVVYTQGRRKESKIEYKTQTQTPYLDIPIVVLINQGSASASEIVTGALKDHHRAVIMGEKSFGKASVQTVLPIDKNSALKLTTARYYTPAGNQIHDIGIIPDIIIDNTAETTQSDEAESEGGATAATQTDDIEEKDEDEENTWISFDDRIKQDPQVNKAATHLHTMIQTAENS